MLTSHHAFGHHLVVLPTSNRTLSQTHRKCGNFRLHLRSFCSSDSTATVPASEQGVGDEEAVQPKQDARPGYKKRTVIFQ